MEIQKCTIFVKQHFKKNMLKIKHTAKLRCKGEKVFSHVNVWLIEKKMNEMLSPKKRILQSPKHVRYYWWRLHALKKSLKKF